MPPGVPITQNYIASPTACLTLGQQIAAQNSAVRLFGVSWTPTNNMQCTMVLDSAADVSTEESTKMLCLQGPSTSEDVYTWIASDVPEPGSC